MLFAVVLSFAVIAFSPGFAGLSGGGAGAADESKVKAATGHVETGARKIGVPDRFPNGGSYAR
jgi:hypothetical protein